MTKKIKTVKCDGGDKDLGHPHVYLSVSKEQKAVCPYCGKIFELKDKD